IIDLYNQEIVSYTLGVKPSLASIVKMTAHAGASLPHGCTPILHSDNGWQFRDRTFRRTLEQFGIVQSMSEPGKCHDNAVAENFFSIVKTEFFYRRQFRSVTEFRGALAGFLWYYNNKRIKNKFQTSPVQFRERESMQECAIVY
ncbi:MAG: IS3 family transposase, partial [Treponemataceae bacterium]|nr:IS3 family transposase [Treponemataceae bacterium]